MTKTHPANDWEWADDAEEGFVDWFNGSYGSYSLRSEWFFGDCEVGDEKTRKDLLYKWIHAAYIAGYERGLYGKLEEQND